MYVRILSAAMARSTTLFAWDACPQSLYSPRKSLFGHLMISKKARTGILSIHRFVGKRAYCVTTEIPPLHQAKLSLVEMRRAVSAAGTEPGTV